MERPFWRHAGWSQGVGCQVAQRPGEQVNISCLQTRSGQRGTLFMGPLRGRGVGPLRLWRFEQSELKRNEIYSIRGLRVVADTAWDSDQGKYAAKSDGSRTFVCAWRSAVQHVTGVPCIARWFC